MFAIAWFLALIGALIEELCKYIAIRIYEDLYDVSFIIEFAAVNTLDTVYILRMQIAEPEKEVNCSESWL